MPGLMTLTILACPLADPSACQRSTFVTQTCQTLAHEAAIEWLGHRPAYRLIQWTCGGRR